MEWDLLTKLVDLHNAGKIKEVNSFIRETDFKDMQQLKSAAISCFSLARENVAENIDVANKLAEFEYDGFRDNFRATYAKDLAEELGEQLRKEQGE